MFSFIRYNRVFVDAIFNVLYKPHKARSLIDYLQKRVLMLEYHYESLPERAISPSFCQLRLMNLRVLSVKQSHTSQEKEEKGMRK